MYKTRGKTTTLAGLSASGHVIEATGVKLSVVGHHWRAEDTTEGTAALVGLNARFCRSFCWLIFDNKWTPYHRLRDSSMTRNRVQWFTDWTLIGFSLGSHCFPLESQRFQCLQCFECFLCVIESKQTNIWRNPWLHLRSLFGLRAEQCAHCHWGSDWHFVVHLSRAHALHASDTDEWHHWFHHTLQHWLAVWHWLARYQVSME